MTKTKLLNKAVREWGFENEFTIELFKMNERGESLNLMEEYFNLAEGAMQEDFFGFDF